MEEKFCFEKARVDAIARLCAVGVDVDSAFVLADCLATADLYGVSSHGTRTLDAHLDKIKRGDYNLKPNFEVMRETPAFALINADNAIGAVSADYCMRYAMNGAKRSGIFTVLARGANTLGAAFYYPLKAAEEGFIAMISTNSPAQMSPIGGRERLLGTNPFSVVIPVPDSDPIIIDMSSSVVAKSKFAECKEKGEPLPEGWALDSEGRPTRDPDEGISGLVLPMAGFKGVGMSMLVDVLSGVLSGSAYLNRVGRFYSEDGKPMNVGYYITVIDPCAVLGDGYKDAVRDFVSILRSSAPIDGSSVILPGDDRLSAKRKNS